MDNILTLKNFLPKPLFYLYKSKVYSDKFPWFYCGDVTTSSQVEHKNPGFAHKIFDEDLEVCSEYYIQFLPIFALIHDISGIYPKNLLRMRLGLQLNNFSTNKFNLPHIDYTKKHLTALYYFDDNDGDTYIFDEKFGSEKNQEPTILQSITPEENKLVIFDGMRFHSSSNPKNYPRRTVLTINFESD